MKRMVRYLVRRLGYTIERIEPRRSTTPPLIIAGAERDSSLYNRIWSDDTVREKYLTPKREEFYAEVLKFSEAHGVFGHADSLVDVGCGPGYLTRAIAKHYPLARLVGLDFSPEALARARKSCPRAVFLEHDIYQPITDTFDVAFCTEVVEHLMYPARALRMVLACAPCVVVTVPNGRIDTYAGHINFWSLESWRVFLEEWRDGWDCTVQYVCDNAKIATVLRQRQPSGDAGASHAR